MARQRGLAALPPSVVPTIDIAALLSDTGDALAAGRGTPAAKAAVAALIDAACTDVGFFGVVNHGLDERLRRGVLTEASAFFALPDAEKSRIAMPAGGASGGRGFQRMALNETQGAADHHEAIDWIRSHARDDGGSGSRSAACQVVAASPSLAPLVHGANLWPRTPPTFAPLYGEYVEAMLRTGHAVLRGMSLALGLPETRLSSWLAADSLWVMRAIRYPPLSPAARAGGVLGCGAHTDYGLLTLVNADESEGSLEVQDRAGLWRAARTPPSALVVNIGDMVNLLTAERWKSTSIQGSPAAVWFP